MIADTTDSSLGNFIPVILSGSCGERKVGGMVLVQTVSGCVIEYAGKRTRSCGLRAYRSRTLCRFHGHFLAQTETCHTA